MSTWRLLNVETYDPFMNMAIDEAVLNGRVRDLVPNTLRFYRWKPSTVSIGKFQNPENEVQLDNCREQGVEIVRRITGGGTVYHDAGAEITYSVVARKVDLGTEDIATIYGDIYGGVVEALKILGVVAEFGKGDLKMCPNLTVNGKKISGSAQCHTRGVVLQHGTLLMRVDLKKMFTFLRVPWGKTCMEIVGVAEQRISSIADELGRDVAMTELIEALKQGFMKALKINLVEGHLLAQESELAKELSEHKYRTDIWNFRGTSSTS